jgi:hypothetical protein
MERAGGLSWREVPTAGAIGHDADSRLEGDGQSDAISHDEGILNVGFWRILSARDLSP